MAFFEVEAQEVFPAAIYVTLHSKRMRLVPRAIRSRPLRWESGIRGRLNFPAIVRVPGSTTTLYAGEFFSALPAAAAPMLAPTAKPASFASFQNAKTGKSVARRPAQFELQFRAISSIEQFAEMHAEKGLRLFTTDIAEPVRFCAELLRRSTGGEAWRDSPILAAVLRDVRAVLSMSTNAHNPPPATPPAQLPGRKLRARELCRLAAYLVQYELVDSELLQLLGVGIVGVAHSIEQFDLSRALYAWQRGSTLLAAKGEAVPAVPGLFDALLSRARQQVGSMSAKTLSDFAGSMVALKLTDPLLMVELAAHFSARLQQDAAASSSSSSGSSSGGGGGGRSDISAGPVFFAPQLAKALAAFAQAGVRARPAGAQNKGRANMRISEQVAHRYESMLASAAPRADLYTLGVLARSSAQIGLGFPPVNSAGVAVGDASLTPPHDVWAAIDARAVALLHTTASHRGVSVFAAALARAVRAARDAHSGTSATSGAAAATAVQTASAGPLPSIDDILVAWLEAESLPPTTISSTGSSSQSGPLTGPALCEHAWDVLAEYAARHAESMTPLELSHVLWALVDSGRLHVEIASGGASETSSALFDAISSRMMVCLQLRGSGSGGGDTTVDIRQLTAPTASVVSSSSSCASGAVGDDVFEGQLVTISANTTRCYVVTGNHSTPLHADMLAQLCSAAARSLTSESASSSTTHTAKPLRFVDVAMLLDCILRVSSAAVRGPTRSGTVAPDTPATRAPLDVACRDVAEAAAASICSAPESGLIRTGPATLRRLERGLTAALSLQWNVPIGTASTASTPSGGVQDLTVGTTASTPNGGIEQQLPVFESPVGDTRTLLGDALGRVQLVLEGMAGASLPAAASSKPFHRTEKKRKAQPYTTTLRSQSSLSDNSTSRSGSRDIATKALLSTFL